MVRNGTSRLDLENTTYVHTPESPGHRSPTQSPEFSPQSPGLQTPTQSQGPRTPTQSPIPRTLDRTPVKSPLRNAEYNLVPERYGFSRVITSNLRLLSSEKKFPGTLNLDLPTRNQYTELTFSLGTCVKLHQLQCYSINMRLR